MLLICVFHLKKRLTVLDGELRHHHARPEHIAVHCDVVAEDLGENPPGLQPPIQRLVTHPYPPLQSPIFRQIHVVPGAFDFDGVAAVALVSLHSLARLEEVPQNLIENFTVSILTSRVWPLNPEERFREAVEEERGFVDLLGGSNQSQMSGYSPSSPPPRRKKRGVPRIGDAWKRAGTGWTTKTVEGTTTMVAAIKVGGKGKRG